MVKIQKKQYYRRIHCGVFNRVYFYYCCYNCYQLLHYQQSEKMFHYTWSKLKQNSIVWLEFRNKLLLFKYNKDYVSNNKREKIILILCKYNLFKLINNVVVTIITASANKIDITYSMSNMSSSSSNETNYICFLPEDILHDLYKLSIFSTFQPQFDAFSFEIFTYIRLHFNRMSLYIPLAGVSDNFCCYKCFNALMLMRRYQSWTREDQERRPEAEEALMRYRTAPFA